MGRKIPGKKHRGVKDPTKQQKKRLSELNKVINAPPRDKDEQAIPKSLERVMKLKQSVKDGKMMKKNTKKKTKLKNQLIVMGNHHPQIAHPKARPEKVVPVFSQRPDECGKAFLNRVNSETQAFINETAFEDKYGVEVKRDPSTGNIEGLSKRSKDEIDELMRLKLKHSNTKKKKKKKKKKDTETTRLTKAQKRKHKLELKKTKKLQDNIDEFNVFKETIEFGDVVHAPPELKIKPKKADASHSERPGRRRLLLDSLFKSHDKSAENPTGVKSVNRSGKRKDLPVGERRQLEERQKEAITAYRNLKSRKAADL